MEGFLDHRGLTVVTGRQSPACLPDGCPAPGEASRTLAIIARRRRVSGGQVPATSLRSSGRTGVAGDGHRWDAEATGASACCAWRPFAERNGSDTTAFDNAFDWASGLEAKVRKGRPTVMLPTSPGGRGRASVLAAATTDTPVAGADPRGSLASPGFPQDFDVDGLRNPDVRARLLEVLPALALEAPLAPSDR